MDKQASKTAVETEQAQAGHEAAETQAARAAGDLTNIRMPERKHSIVGGKCLDFECGAGSASVDLYTGRLLFTLPLFRNQDTLPVSLIYNSFYYDAVQKGNRIGFGMGLNIQGGLMYYNDERAFIDGAGIAEYFDYALPREANGTSAYEDTAKTRKFKIYEKTGDLASKTGKHVSNGTKLTFPNSEYLYTDGVSESYIGAYHKMCGADDELTELKYEYSDGSLLEKQLLKVTNGDTTVISLTYNGTKLVNSITKGTETVNFGYSNGYLKTVQRVDGGVSTILLTCTYDTNGNLVQAESFGNILRFTHSGGKVTSVEERSRYVKVGATAVTNDLIGNKWNINHINGSWTRVTDKNELITDYFFGEGGKLIAESVAQNSLIEPYKVVRGNMNFSQVERFQGNVTISGKSTEVMRERVHGCQAALKSTDVAYTYADAVNFDMKQNTTGTKIFGSHNVSGSDLYVFTCWVKVASCMDNYVKFTDGEARNVGSDTFFGVRAQWFSSKAGGTKSLYVPLNAEIGGWQFVALPFRSLSDRSARVDWFMDFANNSGKVDIKFPAIYKTHGNWRVSLDQDYSITYGNKKNEVSLFNINGFTAKKVLRENFTDTVLKTYTTEYTAISEYRLLNDTDYSGVKTTYSYDSRGRVTGKTMSKSTLSSHSDWEYTPDNSGRIASELTAGGLVKYTYNAYGDPLTVKTPKGDGTTYTYDNRGRLKTITSTKLTSNTQSIDYNCEFPVKYTCNTKTYEMTYDGFGRVLEVKENGSVKKSVVYKDFGISLDGVLGATNSVTVTFANGFKTASYTDKYGQLIRVSENDSSVSEFTYENSGNLKQHIDNSSGVIYTYSYENGLPKSSEAKHRSGTILLDTTYSYSDGEANGVTFEYGGNTDTYTQETDNLGRLTKETTPLGTVDYQYDNFGRVTRKTGYGQTESYSYFLSSAKGGKNVAFGCTNMPTGVTYKDGSAYYYTYDNNGNITQITNRDKSDSIVYTYDTVGRILTETRAGKYYRTYTYDNNGNIKKKTDASSASASAAQTQTDSYHYTNGILTGINDKSITYDGNGNPTNYLGTVCEWTRGRLLKKFGNTSFEYDANGLRRKKGNKEYVWSGDRLLYEKEDGEITTRYFYDASGIAGYNYRGGEFKFRKNLQGDIIGIIDSTGTLLGTYEYDAWGNCTATKVIISGTSMVLSMNPFRYRGYYFDSETGLYYLQSRYYDPKTGRFISPDAYSYLEPETVNGLNLYSYCANNPVMNVDPSGHFPLLAILLTGLIGALMTGAMQAISVRSNGGDAREAWGAFAGGFVTGFFLSAAIAFGGAMAVSGASALMLMGATVGTMAVGFGIGIASYALENAIKRNGFNFSKASYQGALTAISGGVNFALGATFGLFGGYNSLKDGNGLGKQISNSNGIFQEAVGSKFGMASMVQGVASYCYSNLLPMALRMFFKHFFSKPFIDRIPVI